MKNQQLSNVRQTKSLFSSLNIRYHQILFLKSILTSKNLDKIEKLNERNALQFVMDRHVKKQNFIDKNPSLSTYWRSVILLGRNTASYKFALAKSLLENGRGQVSISIDELAVSFAQNISSHLKENKKQSTGRSNSFLDACRKFNSSDINLDELVSVTKKQGFRYVFDAFHNVAKADIPLFFEHNKSGLVLTDNFHNLIESNQSSNLIFEAESRWCLWETAISMDISPHLIEINFDSEDEFFFIRDKIRRVDVTSSKDALIGYQKGKCFYCGNEIKIQTGFQNSCEVDHFFPHMLKNFNFRGINQIWNLILSCKTCNRGEDGKFERIPDISFLELLNKRNNYYAESPHPLRETIINQTGDTSDKRRQFLQKAFNNAVEILPAKQKWTPPYQHGATF